MTGAATGGLRRTEFRRALHRANLLMGGERELVMFTALVAGGLILTAQNWIATAVGLSVWFGLIGFLRTMAKADPRLSHVYTRHLQYQAYYPARSRPARDR
ncbi:conjugal transfer protein TrbD [Azospirillum sp. TSA2s]|uniref:conjugal transfer protein TrbD n=1 Tax=Azospirillum sp. TSA2s TaxID=709810 RepID=UPI00211032A2|nr:conjugal transfer protein TrbD [Azospirillum sp. TSA2s]